MSLIGEVETEARKNLDVSRFCFRINPILRVVIGQRRIEKLLESWQGFQPHAEWVSRLIKPY